MLRNARQFFGARVGSALADGTSGARAGLESRTPPHPNPLPRVRGRGDKRAVARVLLLVLVAVCFAATSRAEDPKRIPWTASHVPGSPEPPPPYQTVRVFPDLTFKAPVEVGFAAGVDRIFVAEEKG